ncbi:MAG: hypothetical protein AAB776_03085 [Patescibacteria group bacterium]
MMTNASLKYRPVRIGLLVNEGSIEELIAAASWNSILWGGLYNPIIPCGANQELTKSLIELFSVDVLYPVGKSEAITKVINDHPFLREQRHIEGLFHEQTTPRTRKRVLAPTYLSLKDIADYFWYEEMRHKDSSYRSDFIHYTWEQSDDLNGLLSLMYGRIPSAGSVPFKYPFDNIFLNGLRADSQAIKVSDPVPYQEKYAVIQATRVLLREYGDGFYRNGGGVYVGSHSSFNDLLAFWNLRASGIDLTFFSTDARDRTLAAAKAQLDSVRKRLDGREMPFAAHPTIYHQINDNDSVDSQIKLLFSEEERKVIHHVSDHSWNGHNVKPVTCSFSWEQTSGSASLANEQPSVRFQLPPMDFLRNPEDFDSSTLAVDVDVYHEGDYEKHTLKPPYLCGLDEYYKRGIHFSPFGLRLHGGGISLLIETNDHDIRLSPLSKVEIVHKIFDLVGLRSKPSQPGIVAQKIIDHFGGLEKLRSLKLDGVRNLLESLEPEDTVTRGRATQVIHESNLTRHRFLSSESKGINAPEIFNGLLKQQVFRPGLELTCASCTLTNWFSLIELDDEWVCRYCAAKELTSIQLGNRGDWKFRKNGLFARQNKQDGAIPVILTLLTLNRRFRDGKLLLLTNTKLDGDGVDCESDFVAVIKDNGSGKLEICIGECKSGGGEINQEDCDKLTAAADTIKKNDQLDCCLLFAKTAEDFTDAEKTLFKGLIEKGYRIVLFTNRELEPYEPYWSDGDGENLPQKYAHSLEDFSANSRARYLSDNGANQQSSTGA